MRQFIGMRFTPPSGCPSILIFCLPPGGAVTGFEPGEGGEEGLTGFRAQFFEGFSVPGELGLPVRVQGFAHPGLDIFFAEPVFWFHSGVKYWGQTETVQELPPSQ